MIKKKKEKYKFKNEAIINLGGKLIGKVRYFTCPFCGLYQIEDKGNFLCWACEDGKLKKPLPKWRISNLNK